AAPATAPEASATAGASRGTARECGEQCGSSPVPSTALYRAERLPTASYCSHVSARRCVTAGEKRCSVMGHTEEGTGSIPVSPTGFEPRKVHPRLYAKLVRFARRPGSSRFWTHMDSELGERRSPRVRGRCSRGTSGCFDRFGHVHWPDLALVLGVGL